MLKSNVIVRFFADLSVFFYPVSIFVAVFLATFLFWRACRHELFDNEEAFDLIVVCTIGALVGARIFDFIFLNWGNWTFSRFVFFNRYGGFDFWGALVGVFVALLILRRVSFAFLRNKKPNPFFVLDLLAAPLVFAQAIISLFTLQSTALYNFIGYLFIFLVLKRLSTRKRHPGFFASFYVVSISLVSMVLFKFRGNEAHLVFGKVPYEFLAPAAFLFLGSISWYILAKRSLAKDVANFFGFVLLSIFRTRRMITSVNESGNFSKSMMLSPYYAVKIILGVLLFVAKEIKLAFFELMYVFGLRRFSK